MQVWKRKLIGEELREPGWTTKTDSRQVGGESGW